VSNLGELLAELPRRLGDHVLLSGSALGLGVALSLPLGLVVARTKALRLAVVGTAGVIQTVPGLALLALMVPLFRSFGFVPALAALVLYSMLPVLQNTVAGISGVDPELVEAAEGLGMTRRQILTRVEVPLALPVIVAGIRTAAVWVVGTATLSTPVGQPSLGNYIFGGLQTRNYTAVLVGCVSAALLAVVLDSLLGAVEGAVSAKKPRRAIAAGGSVVLLFAAGALLPILSGPRSAPAALPSSTPTTSATPGIERVRVGAKTFTEQYVLAELIAGRLEHAGLGIDKSDSLGSTVIFDALRQSQIDVYVDYSGTLWANAMKRTEVEPAWRVRSEVSGWLAREQGIRCLGALGFENAYALAMRRDRANELGIESISDLARVAKALTIGSDYEFFQRPEWTRLRQVYGLAFATRTPFDSTFMYEAVKKKTVDVITAFSSDGRIQAYDLVVLSDPKAAFPPYEALLLLSPRVANDARVSGALEPLVGRIDVDHMRAANLLVDRDENKKTPNEAAAWLWSAIAPK
jgi:osmoprotectant transport system substrate-binding protein/osmoprotectant transport system permease protein